MSFLSVYAVETILLSVISSFSCYQKKYANIDDGGGGGGGDVTKSLRQVVTHSVSQEELTVGRVTLLQLIVRESYLFAMF